MRFELLIDGKVHKVDLAMGKVVTVEVDGRLFQAEVGKNSQGLTVTVDGDESVVRLGSRRVSIDGSEHKVEVRRLRRGMPSWYSEGSGVAASAADGKVVHKPAGGEGAIHPPMPGRVISIKVKEGDTVRAGDPVLVLEAMKMQNEIASHMDGVVKEIRVAEGDLVETGNILMVLGS
jgi:biotin carboxyl carrier protein